MAIDFRKSISDPPAMDIGNKTTQGRNVPKTIQLSSFTINKNAVWAANIQLMKDSFPFAVITFPANRNLFRLQIGDPFNLHYSKYNISGMVCRVMNIQEKELSSEEIVVSCIQDFYSVVTPISQSNYTAPVDNQIPEPDYTVTDLVYVNVLEAPYALSNTVKVIPMACRSSDIMIGFNFHMSIDGGASYNFLSNSLNIVPFGLLNADYNQSYPIDMSSTGIVIDFEADASSVETVTFAIALTGNSNLGLIGNELISFTTITPIAGSQYRLTGIFRGRFGTEQVDHAASTEFFFVDKSMAMIYHSEIAPGADRRFKFVGYNRKKTGEIASAPAEDLSITGVAKTPYKPINFVANDVSFASRYDSGDDIVLGWSARKRGTGAGIGIPGEVVAIDTREGLFEIEVWVSSILVRTITALDAITWTYTNAMNVSDNGTPAGIITFKITNYLEEDGVIYSSNQNEIICKQN